MKSKNIFISGIMMLFSFAPPNNFLNEQKKFERVRTAIAEKETYLKKIIANHQMAMQQIQLLMVAYKDQDVLDIYAKNRSAKTYKKILSYPICARSGQLGPKRAWGDEQVPEGFYHINRFNPNSNFYLSLGLNYPNLSDRRKGKAADLGGDIFIHGSCVTIGCLPMTDNYIKEIYMLAVHAKYNGQNHIPIYIFPFEMNDENWTNYSTRYKEQTALIAFWKNLKQGYDQFINSKKELNIRVAENGDYIFQ